MESDIDFADLLIPTAVVAADPDFIFLADKGFRSEEERQVAIAKVQDGYNPRAIQRRALRGIAARHGGELFTIHDVPVARRYVEALAQTGAEICAESRWLNAVSVRADPEQVARLARLSFVRDIRPVAVVRAVATRSMGCRLNSSRRSAWSRCTSRATRARA